MSDDIEGVTRRTFLSRAAAAATLAGTPLQLLAQDAPVVPPEIATAGRPQGTDKFGSSVDNVPIIDAHIHLFDGRRTQGAGYMGSAAYRALSQTSLPGMFATLARPSGIVGAIIVESSARVEDNAWYLDVSEANPFMVGVSGRLDPYSPQFGENLARFQKNRLYRAIRASRFYTNTDG
jgi:L-fuconolactonase